LAALDDPVHFADVRIEGMRVADYKMQAGTVCPRNNFIAFLERESQRLLDQNMLAFLHRFDRLARVKSMRRRDVDGLDRSIPAQIMKVRIDRCVELLTERLAWARQRIHRGAECDSWMCYRGADHERTSEPKSCYSKSDRGQCASASRFYTHETQPYAGIVGGFRATC